MAGKDKRIEYAWNTNSVIRRIDVRQENNGRAIAYIYADEAPAASASRQAILNVLHQEGLGTVADYHHGKFSLRVSGFNNAEALISLLTRHELVKEPSAVNASVPTQEKPKSFLESVRSNSLRAAGVFYSLGNIVYLSSGLLRSHEKGTPDYGQIGSALIWGSGDILIATIGGRDDGRQFTSLLTKLKQHYDKEGISTTNNTAIHVETSTRDKTLGGQVYDFLHTYVNPIKCATEVLASFGYYQAGKAQGNVWKQRTAVTFGMGFLASLLIPERKIDEEKYAQAGPLGKLWMKIQSNPLSVGGISGYSNTIFTTVGAYQEGQRFHAKGPVIKPSDGGPSKYYKLDYAAPAVMLFGNTFYAISKKNTGGDIKTQDAVSDIYSIAAQIINTQSDEVTRQAALDSTVRFLSERPEIKDTHAQILVRLKGQMQLQKQNPWFGQGHVAVAASEAVTAAVAEAEPMHHIRTDGLEHSKDIKIQQANEITELSYHI